MKRLALLIAVLAMVLPLSGAMADPVCTDAACVTAGEGGYVLVLDGSAANPDPADGFISVREDGQVCGNDDGTADDGNPDNGPESDSPVCP